MDLERIEALIEVVKDAKVMELSVKHDGASVLVRKSPNGNGYHSTKSSKQVLAKGCAATMGQCEETPAGIIIKAPMVGIFHLTDSVRTSGAVVKKGQTVGSIESMKLMNDVASCSDGKIAEIYVEDGMPVEYGQTLFKLDEV